VPRLGRGALQVAVVLIAAGTWWLRCVIGAHGLATSSAELIGAQLLLGAGIGMFISPLFDFILASVKDHEVGSASGVLNAAQQLASAIGVAAIGTVFFSTLARSGFTAAIRECLMIELGVAAALFVLARALPRHPRDAGSAETEPPRRNSRAASTDPPANIPAAHQNAVV
jgi:hypothetical protein